MLAQSLLVVAITTGIINPMPAAGLGTPAALIARYQATTVPSGTPGTGQPTNPWGPAEGSPVTRLYPSAVPPRPHYVAGYTFHALKNMRERNITKAQVEALIASPIVGSYQDDNDTWLVTDGILIVIINKNAYIVTGYGKD
jgi:hypothetical protein